MKNPTEAEKLKDVEVDINRMKNRIEKLKKKSLFEKSSIEKNKSMADQILYQKMLLAEEIAERNRNNSARISKEKQHIEYLKLRNSRKRSQQKEQINNIMRAIYLVKIDDAREMKRVSMEHKNNLRQINSSFIEEKKKKIHEYKSREGEKEKEFWKEKLYRLYLENQAGKEQNKEMVLERKEELEKLKKQQEQILDYYSRIQNVSAESKRQYTTALSLPLRQVASVLQMKKKKGDSPSKEQTKKKILKKAKEYLQEEEKRLLEDSEHHFPKTEVNEDKLKIVLERLKRKKEEAEDQN